MGMGVESHFEEAHGAVRHHTGQEMRRQKRYHDTRVNWQSFKKTDKAYDFSRSGKQVIPPKFTSFWIGPYSVLDKL